MVVTRVWAEINGVVVEMVRGEGDAWSIEAPTSEDGFITCAFWAEDDAGNIAYKTATLWLFDGRLTCIHWVDDPMQVALICSDMAVVMKESLFASEFIDDGFSARALSCPLSVEFVPVRCTHD